MLPIQQGELEFSERLCCELPVNRTVSFILANPRPSQGGPRLAAANEQMNGGNSVVVEATGLVGEDAQCPRGLRPPSPSLPDPDGAQLRPSHSLASPDEQIIWGSLLPNNLLFSAGTPLTLSNVTTSNRRETAFSACPLCVS